MAARAVDRSEEPGSRRALIRDVSLLYASTFIVLAGASVSPSLPAIARAFADAPGAAFWVRWVLTLPALAGLLSAPVVGWAMDRWGRVRILAASVALYTVAGGYPLLARSLTGVLVSRAVLGIAIAGTATGAITLLADYYQGERLHRLMGLQGMVNSFGGVAYALLGGYLGEVSWRAGFGLLLLGGLALPGIICCAHDPAPVAPAQPGVADSAAPLPWRRVGLVYAVAFAGMLLFYLVPVQLSFYLAERIQAGPGEVGVVHAAMNLSGALMAIGYGRARASALPERLFIAVFGLMAAGYVLLALAHSFGAALAALLVFGLGMGWMIPNQNVWLVALTPLHLRGRAVGGLNTARQIGQVLSPIAVAPVAALVGLSGAFAVGAGAMGAIALAFALGSLRRR
jgi:MFS family permease